MLWLSGMVDVHVKELKKLREQLGKRTPKS
jgi:hypothetical protein